VSRKVLLLRRWKGKVPKDRDGQPIPRELWPRRRACVYLVRWWAQTHEGQPRRMSKRFAERAPAEAFQAELQAKLDNAPEARKLPKALTLDQFIEEFAALRIGPGGQRLRPKSVESALYVLKGFAAYIGGDRVLAKVTAADAVRYFGHLHDKGLSDSSVNLHKRTLKSAFGTAVRQLHYLPANPLADIRPNRVTETPIRHVTEAEFAALLTACRQMADPLWWETFVTLCYVAGLRAGEATHLTWADIDFARGFVRVAPKPASPNTLAWQPKDAEVRHVPVPPALLALLAKMQADAPEGHAYVFISAARLRMIQDAQASEAWGETQAVLNNLGRDFRRLVKTGGKTVRTLVTGDGKPSVSLHDLRRSCITNWAKRVSIQVVMKLAGHSNIETTRRSYLSTTEDQMQLAQQAAAAALADAMARVPAPAPVTATDSATNPAGAQS